MNLIKDIPHIRFDIHDIPLYIKNISRDTSSADSDEPNIIATIDGDEYAKVFDQSFFDGKELTVELKPITEQKRKHRSKRINKKWLKKYGYSNSLVIYDLVNYRNKPLLGNFYGLEIPCEITYKPFSKLRKILTQMIYR